MLYSGAMSPDGCGGARWRALASVAEARESTPCEG
jgi:hypothetical protein